MSASGTRFAGLAALLFGLCLLPDAALAVGPSVYRCVDADGQVRFSDRACGLGDRQSTVRVPRKQPSADAESARLERLREVIDSLERSRAEREAERAARRAAAEAAERERRKQRCKQVRAEAERLRTTPDGQFYRRLPDEPGTVEPLSHESGTREAERLRVLEAQNCR